MQDGLTEKSKPYRPVPASSLPCGSSTLPMQHDRKIIDRQVGRNAQLFAQSIADLGSAEQRFPYLRILVSLVEQAHPEWSQTPQKDQRVAQLIHQMSDDQLDEEEVAEVVRVRDAERRR